MEAIARQEQLSGTVFGVSSGTIELLLHFVRLLEFASASRARRALQGHAARSKGGHCASVCAAVAVAQPWQSASTAGNLLERSQRSGITTTQQRERRVAAEFRQFQQPSYTTMQFSRCPCQRFSFRRCLIHSWGLYATGECSSSFDCWMCAKVGSSAARPRALWLCCRPRRIRAAASSHKTWGESC